MRSLPGKLLIHFIFHQGGNKLMTKEEFRKLTENILILDGATGSNLMASGMPARHLYRDLGY